MTTGIENLRVESAARAAEQLTNMMRGRAVANLMTNSCLAAPKTDNPPLHPERANAENCLWCRAGRRRRRHCQPAGTPTSTRPTCLAPMNPPPPTTSHEGPP